MIPSCLRPLLYALIPLALGLVSGRSFGIAKPGVFEALEGIKPTANFASSGIKVFLPLPLEYREQIQLSYELTVEPHGSVPTLVIEEGRLDNWVAHPNLADVEEGDVIQIDWKARVLIGERDLKDLPGRTQLPTKWPEEARPWLASTRIVQSDYESFQAIGKELKHGNKAVLDIVERALKTSRKIHGQQDGSCQSLDALQALEKAGSCTSTANLLAALMRSEDVPARIVAGQATWYGPHQAHYIVESGCRPTGGTRWSRPCSARAGTPTIRSR